MTFSENERKNNKLNQLQWVNLKTVGVGAHLSSQDEQTFIIILPTKLELAGWNLNFGFLLGGT